MNRPVPDRLPAAAASSDSSYLEPGVAVESRPTRPSGWDNPRNLAALPPQARSLPAVPAPYDSVSPDQVQYAEAGYEAVRSPTRGAGNVNNQLTEA